MANESSDRVLDLPYPDKAIAVLYVIAQFMTILRSANKLYSLLPPAFCLLPPAFCLLPPAF